MEYFQIVVLGLWVLLLHCSWCICGKTNTIRCTCKKDVGFFCCSRVSLRWWRWTGGRGLSSAAEDQEWCFLHARPEEVKVTDGQRPAALAHTQVLNQRTLLQPQGTINRTHTHNYHFNVSLCWHISSCKRAAVSCAGVPVLQFHYIVLRADFINVPQSTRLHWIPSSVSPKSSMCATVHIVPEQTPAAGISSLL